MALYIFMLVKSLFKLIHFRVFDFPALRGIKYNTVTLVNMKKIWNSTSIKEMPVRLRHPPRHGVLNGGIRCASLQGEVVLAKI